MLQYINVEKVLYNLPHRKLVCKIFRNKKVLRENIAGKRLSGDGKKIKPDVYYIKLENRKYKEL